MRMGATALRVLPSDWQAARSAVNYRQTISSCSIPRVAFRHRVRRNLEKVLSRGPMKHVTLFKKDPWGWAQKGQNQESARLTRAITWLFSRLAVLFSKSPTSLFIPYTARPSVTSRELAHSPNGNQILKRPATSDADPPSSPECVRGELGMKPYVVLAAACFGSLALNHAVAMSLGRAAPFEVTSMTRDVGYV
jgi:hypothetical protein